MASHRPKAPVDWQESISQTVVSSFPFFLSSFRRSKEQDGRRAP
jgi:hypothetical protein